MEKQDEIGGDTDKISLRDHFAGLAMQSYIQVTEADWHARRYEEPPPTDPTRYLDEITDWAYQAADAMLLARAKASEQQ